MKRTVSILVSLIAAFSLVKAWAAYQLKSEVKRLFAGSETTTGKYFSHAQLVGLPAPVQRYFKHVLKEGQPYINHVRLRHVGQFKTDLKKGWVDIKGEQYFTAPTPGFIWIGTTAFFTARDMFLNGQGSLKVKLFSLLQVAEGTGPTYDEGELLRWLGESAWFPTNLLPTKNLSWSHIDENTARLRFTYNQLTVTYNVSFNALGEITVMETKRYMGEKSLETWVGRFSDYQEIYGVVVPTKAEGIWRLPSGDHSYAKFQVKVMEYNKPELFR
ncbi:DUF6544 family protein [Rufibacter hautae]|uniref:Uncharacterized protein n=1 Tax=Rufibacter hautae TaxID=2595005 RepID=A0A5B6TDR0_9BACT|nr:DUF6544 family protein [Rufibacter hautae]KAA3437119.1 hypothetical protein FOA19_22400 [Rufibacter hautae]